MIDWDSCFLFQIPDEGMQAMKSGEGQLGAGGVRNTKGSSFIKQAKPVPLSIADIKSFLGSQDDSHELWSHLCALEDRDRLSDEAYKQLQEAEWLNTVAIKRTYVATRNGFMQTIHAVESVSNQIGLLEEYIKCRDRRALKTTAQKYINYMNSDAGKLRLVNFDITNSNIDSHLDEMAAMLNDLINSVMCNEREAFISAVILFGLLQPFTYVVRRYSSLYFIENKEMPGDYYPQWQKIISFVSENREFHNRLMYFINLYSNLSFRDKMILCGNTGRTLGGLLPATEFDRRYALSHSKEEYLSCEERIRKGLVQQDYKTKGKRAYIILQ